MNLNTFPRFLVFLMAILVAAALLSSCYTQNKAGKQVARALREYPDTAAALIRDDFPCVDGKPDSTEFLKSIDDLKTLLRTADNRAKAYSGRLQQIRDSMRMAQAASGDDCPTLLAQATDYIAEANLTIDSLKWELDSEKGVRKKLTSYVNNIKPVIQPVEDSAKIRLANRDRDYWAMKYQIDHEWRVNQEKKMEGTLPLYPPWWLIIVLAIVSGLLIAAKIKKGILNPLALFTKKNNT